MRQIKYLILHCTATPAGKDYSKKELDVWHKARGFAECGYHYMVCHDGTIQQGREISKVGAHCHVKGHTYNQYSVGIAYYGGLDANGQPADTRTSAQMLALHELVHSFELLYPSAQVLLHNEVSSKSCPCFLRSKWETEHAMLYPPLGLQ